MYYKNKNYIVNDIKPSYNNIPTLNTITLYNNKKITFFENITFCVEKTLSNPMIYHHISNIIYILLNTVYNFQIKL